MFDNQHMNIRGFVPQLMEVYEIKMNIYFIKNSYGSRQEGVERENC